MHFDFQSLVSPISALVGVMVGLFASHWTSRRQSRVTAIAAEQRARIEALRTNLAELITVPFSLAFHYDHGLGDDSEKRRLIADWNRRIATVRLFLDPDRKLHGEFIDEIAVVNFKAVQLFGKKIDDKEFSEASAKLVKFCQRILKDEWETVRQQL